LSESVPVLAIIASRAARRAELDAYAATRRAAKRDGLRQPRPGDPNPNLARHRWHGAPRLGALYALRWWRPRRLVSLLVPTDPVADDLRRLVIACLESDETLPAKTKNSSPPRSPRWKSVGCHLMSVTAWLLTTAPGAC
jgi:hypothetical protein